MNGVSESPGGISNPQAASLTQAKQPAKQAMPLHKQIHVNPQQNNFFFPSAGIRFSSCFDSGNLARCS